MTQRGICPTCGGVGTVRKRTGLVGRAIRLSFRLDRRVL